MLRDEIRSVCNGQKTIDNRLSNLESVIEDLAKVFKTKPILKKPSPQLAVMADSMVDTDTGNTVVNDSHNLSDSALDKPVPVVELKLDFSKQQELRRGMLRIYGWGEGRDSGETQPDWSAKEGAVADYIDNGSDITMQSPEEVWGTLGAPTVLGMRKEDMQSYQPTAALQTPHPYHLHYYSSNNIS